MKIAVCAAFKVGRELVHFIAEYGHPVEFVATLKNDSEYSASISRECMKHGIPHIPNADVNSPEFAQLVRDCEIDVVLLLWWPTIVKKESIDAAKIGWINLHPALLPFGRGKHPYYWAINENTPFGVTIHFIDPSVDGGKIIAQKEIPHDITDTGETLYNKSLTEIVSLFKEAYPNIVADNLSPFIASAMDVHYGWMLEPHSEIHLDSLYNARDLINRIRGRTFLNGDSAHFIENGKKYRIKVIIEEAE